MSGIDPLPPDDHIRSAEEGMSALPREGEALPILEEPDEPRPVVVPELPFPLHPNFWWGILWCLGLVLFTQIAGLIVAIVLLVAAALLLPNQFDFRQMKGMQDMLNNPVFLGVLGIAQVFAHSLIFIAALVLLRILAGRSWPRQVALRRPAGIHFLLGVLGMPAFIVLGNGAYYVIRHIFHVPSFSSLGLPGMEELDKISFTGWAIPAAVFVIGVTPAFSEEFWCRAFLGRGLVGRHGVILGVLGTSFLFGLIHVDPAQGLMAMLMGVLLHFVYLTTRSLLMPMLLHFLNNSFAVIVVALLPRLAKLDEGEPSIPLYTGSVLLLAGVCWALYASRARIVSAGPNAWHPPFPGVVCPPPDSGAWIETPLPSSASLAAVAAGLTAFVVGLVMALQRTG
jgi:membrane protease YdiL (CAAX protease family)